MLFANNKKQRHFSGDTSASDSTPCKICWSHFRLPSGEKSLSKPFRKSRQNLEGERTHFVHRTQSEQHSIFFCRFRRGYGGHNVRGPELQGPVSNIHHRVTFRAVMCRHVRMNSCQSKSGVKRKHFLGRNKPLQCPSCPFSSGKKSHAPPGSCCISSNMVRSHILSLCRASYI